MGGITAQRKVIKIWIEEADRWPTKQRQKPGLQTTLIFSHEISRTNISSDIPFVFSKINKMNMF